MVEDLRRSEFGRRNLSSSSATEATPQYAQPGAPSQLTKKRAANLDGTTLFLAALGLGACGIAATLMLLPGSGRQQFSVAAPPHSQARAVAQPPAIAPPPIAAPVVRPFPVPTPSYASRPFPSAPPSYREPQTPPPMTPPRLLPGPPYMHGKYGPSGSRRS